MYIYVKSKKRFIGKKSPGAVFYELNRNTFDIGGVESDNLEKLYADLDSRFSKKISKLIETMNLDDYFIDVLILATILKWRVPVNDDVFNKLKEEMNYKDMPIEVKPKNVDLFEKDERLKDLLDSEIFKDAKRIIFPFMPIYKNGKLENIYNNCYLHESKEQYFAILGDCPLIEMPTADVHDLGSIIFPISANHTFIYKIGTAKHIPDVTFYLLRDIATYHYSEKYVGCKNKEYLEAVIGAYEETKTKGALGILLEMLFSKA